MEEALTKYNIQLPVFSKIGGLLASEISIDEAALHAAILAINKAIQNNDLVDLEEKMKNADAHLDDIKSSLLPLSNLYARKYRTPSNKGCTSKN